MERLPVTLEISLISLLISISLAIPIGVVSAIRQDTILDYFLRGFAVGGLSIPSFWLGTLAVVLPAMWFGVIPPLVYNEFTKDPIQNLKQVWLPSLIQGVLLSASVMRITRTMMLEVLRQDYIRTAWSKGLRERAVIFRHALKNAMIPVITVIGLQIGFLLGGSVITEQIFSLPGMGRLLVESLTFRDYPVIQGINFIVASWIILINLCIDLTYGYLDPRIRFR
jgi:peptide/nickel transport system permease protein